MVEIRKKFEGKHSDPTGKILGAFFQLHKEMGYGFSEAEFRWKIYDNSRKGTLDWTKIPRE